MSTNKHYVYVCTKCKKATNSDTTSGEEMYEHLKKEWADDQSLAIRRSTCMGLCERDCNIGFSASKKHSCLFVDIKKSDIPHLKEIIQIYKNHKSGIIPFKNLSSHMQSKYLCRIPKHRA